MVLSETRSLASKGHGMLDVCLTVLMVMNARAPEWENQARFSHAQFSRMVKGSENTRRGHVDGIECIHHQRICFRVNIKDILNLVFRNEWGRGKKSRKHPHGRQIIRFFLVTLPIFSAESGSFPWVHAMGFCAATRAYSAYSSLDSW